MKRFRLRTLMLLIIIAAVLAALLVERRRAARIEAQLEASLAESRAMQAQVLQVLVNRDQLLIEQASARAELENELKETKRFMDSAKSDASKDKR